LSDAIDFTRLTNDEGASLYRFLCDRVEIANSNHWV